MTATNMCSNFGGEMSMLYYRVQSLCGGHLQLILLLGDVYVGL